MTGKYIPRVLLCGDAEIFLRALDGRQIELVGQFDCDDDKILAAAKDLFADADYVVFDDGAKFATNFDALTKLVDENKLLTRDSFLKFAGDNFFALNNVRCLLVLIDVLNVSRLLDADNFFARNEVFATFANGLEVDSVDGNFSARRFPLVENFYRKIFATLDESRLQTYDALLLTADRTPEELFDTLIATDNVAEKILLFVRQSSALEDWLAESSVAFASVEQYPAANGSWAVLTKFPKPDDFRVYVADAVPVATHDTAGLRRYIGDELTALHYLWTNARHSTIGFVDGEISLSRERAIELLRGYDMIVAEGEFSALTPHERTLTLCGQYLNEHVEKIFRKHIKATQPDYLSAFHFVSNGHCLIPSRRFVTRQNIFDAYCAWLFSFVGDVAREVLDTTNLAASEDPNKYRVVATVAERLLTVWLAKNDLRLVPAL